MNYFLFIYLYFDLFIRILLIKYLFLQKNKFCKIYG